ncbi:SIS domain-containing protein [Campylobacter sp. 19-13652]|uniref:KpsF/GutQ family sugar-phosphate isomerase n=1 Tax=Campylobacter sp. 19-13652 TaxID=2840180 RepID=UPI001C780A70|nr:KpsF/GutQ family sugar-phosphate isomerase [Campylobacter sp. 19-13652]BCX78624.1 hypothetical protein LBC_00860 [Campylobacter sp. 19-13652]
MSEILKNAKEVLLTEAGELERAAGLVDESFEQAVRLICAIKGKVVVTGVGKSGHIGRKIAATLASTGTPSFFMHPTEALHGDLGMVRDDDLVLAISFSGESEELVSIAPHLKRLGVKIIAMAKDVSSSLGRLSDGFIPIAISKEACPLGVAPTSSTTLTLALGDALAVCLMKLRGFRREDFASFHPGGMLGKRLFLKAADVMRKENLPIISDEVNLKDAINSMSAGKLGSALLVDKSGALKAVLSDGDLRRALESPEFSLQSPAIKFANQSPKSIKDAQMLAYDALKMIQENKIQLLIITDANTVPVGVLHVHDLTNLGL